MNYHNRSSWIICLLNECSGKGDPKGQKINKLVEDIINAAKDKNITIDLVLINNASKDNTPEILANIQRQFPVIVTVLDEPIQGKAMAERKGIKYILENLPDSEALLTMDADGEHVIPDMIKLCQEYQEKKPLFVIGSRFGYSGQRNKKDEIIRDILIDISELKGEMVPDDPRCGARVYDPMFLRNIINNTVCSNYGLQLEIVAHGLRKRGKIISIPLEKYEPQRSKVFTKSVNQNDKKESKRSQEEINPELEDICRALSNVFGKKKGDRSEGKAIIESFGKKIGRLDLFSELSNLFYKGKMVTEHGQSSPQEFMEVPPDKNINNI